MTSEHSKLPQQAGFWAAVILAVGFLVYLGILAVMLISGTGYPPVEPYQTILHFLILFAATMMVFFWATLHTVVPRDRQFFSLASLALIVIFATLTSINRFVALTVVRQSLASGNTAGLQWFLPYAWPSIMLAMEILGWGLFFGLACLCLAPVFVSGKLERAIFWTLLVTGVLCLLSVVGLLLNSMALLGLVAPLAWGLIPAITFILMAIWFKTRADTAR
jgi:hypothetical protein